MEYSRLWIFSGFTWNPVGLTLASASIYPLQYVSWIGVYGLSFLVIQWNSLLYCVLRKPLDKTKKMLAISYILLFLGLAWAIYEYRDKQFNQVDKSLKVLLVQTAISPGEKIGYGQGKALHPFDQWERIFSLIAPYKHHKIDLVLLPEYALPGSAFDPLYDYESIKSLFKTHLSSVYESSYLPLQVPLAYFDSESNSWRVSNAYIATLLAKCLKTEIVMGMDYRERLQNKVFSYNAAFFVSHEGYYNVYAKHILVPMGEYIPFDCFKSWAKNYGIEDSFAKGSLSPLMGKNNLGISICYEETFGNFMRIKIKKGAKVLVNLSNLAWFANSKLNEQQAEHARIRSVENGVPLMRISNTGVTNIVDSLGREKVRLGTDFPKDEWQRKALYASVPMYSYKTFYTQHGDKPLIIFSLGIIVIFIIIKKNKSS